MRSRRPPLFRKRQFEPVIIVTCVRWYCRFSLSLRDLEELMAERGLAVDHTTVGRWVRRYGPEVHRRLRGQVKLNRPLGTWTRRLFASRAGGCICSGRSTAKARRSTSTFPKRAIGKLPNAF